MAHFARIDKNNIVRRVEYVEDEHLLNEDGEEDEEFGIAYLSKLYGAGFTWVQTSINNNFRKVYAGVGYTYDKVNDVFIVPKPYASWTLDGSFDWQPPTTLPEGSSNDCYIWNEATTSWDLFIE